MASSPERAEATEPQPKRRKVRKGTHTCWECKRRKVRCTFANPGDEVCVGCTKRCLRCVSQEFPEETTTPAAKSRLVGDRIVRVEEMIRQLAEKSAVGFVSAGGGVSGAASGTASEGDSNNSDAASRADTPTGLATPAPSETPQSSAVFMGTAQPPSLWPSRYTAVTPVSALMPGVTHQKLAEALISAFPSRRDLDIIVANSSNAYSHVQLALRSHRDILEQGFWPTSALLIRVTPQTHPVLIAWLMLAIATVLQCADPQAYRQLKTMSEPVRDIMTRLAETAINLVTRNDELLDTLEGLECIMLEGIYRGNSGHLRRSWLAWRRGLSLAQLMRIPHQRTGKPATSFSKTTPTDITAASLVESYHLDPQFLWYRLLITERFMCLLLGLPQTTIDAPIPRPEELGNDTPMGRLESQLGYITSFILDRNERVPRPDDYAGTMKIDREMQDIAAALPSRWWLPPNLADKPGGEYNIWEMIRLIYQCFYYNLLNQLHLPYMLHPSTVSSSSPPSEDDIVQQRHREYSRIACVSASREVLSRYIALRTHNQIAGCCRFAEFFALTASLTLILVHIDGHRTSHNNGGGRAAGPVMPDNLLAHQRLSDRAMTEEALESMELVGRLNEDVISENSVDLLRQLLDIEAETARGKAVVGRNSNSSSDRGETSAGQGELRISVPYVGFITIARDGAITKEAHMQPPAHVPYTFGSPLPPSRAISRKHSIDGPPLNESESETKPPETAAATTTTAMANEPPASAPSTGLVCPASPASPQIRSNTEVCSTEAAPAQVNESLFRTAFDVHLMPRVDTTQHQGFANFASLVNQDPRHANKVPNGMSVGGDPGALQHSTSSSALALLGTNIGSASQQTPTDSTATCSPATANACTDAAAGNGPLQALYPGPAAGTDQWAFQGVDMAFFDNLMRETAMDPGRENNKTWM